MSAADDRIASAELTLSADEAFEKYRAALAAKHEVRKLTPYDDFVAGYAAGNTAHLAALAEPSTVWE